MWPRGRDRSLDTRATLPMMILLLHTSAAFIRPAARLRVHRQLSTCTRPRACGTSASGSAGGDQVTGFMGAFRIPRLKEDDLPEATALSAQIELVAVKFSGVRSTTGPASEEPRRMLAKPPHATHNP